ncbi:MAG: response regulator [Chloroflexi bacterium]|nr:response regulator [Chloroflexota bacterium]
MPDMDEGPVVLIVDDETQIRRFLRISLESNGFRVHEATTGAQGLAQAALLRPDALILDLGLPDDDGLTILKRLREWSRVPVVVLSVRDSDTDKVSLLDAGADDYLTKPFSVDELLARLRVAIRHAQPGDEETVFQRGRLAVDLARRLVTLGDEPVRLTVTEYALLRLFVQHAGRVLTHSQILRQVWGPQYEQETHYLRVYVAHLRQKLEEDPSNPRLILTEPGVGYRLAAW